MCIAAFELIERENSRPLQRTFQSLHRLSQADFSTCRRLQPALRRLADSRLLLTTDIFTRLDSTRLEPSSLRATRAAFFFTSAPSQRLRRTSQQTHSHAKAAARKPEITSHRIPSHRIASPICTFYRTDPNLISTHLVSSPLDTPHLICEVTADTEDSAPQHRRSAAAARIELLGCTGHRTLPQSSVERTAASASVESASLLRVRAAKQSRHSFRTHT